MIQSKRGIIIRELFARQGIQGFAVDIDGREEKCISYPQLTGEIKSGDYVLLNTTAVALGLGTGGYHYIICRINPEEKELEAGGHIMKLRYTPMQLKVLSVEEEDSPYHEKMMEADSLDNIPVLVASLHSMLAPICLELHNRGLKAAYVMTDGAALPAVFSQTIDWLKKNDMLLGTVTVGHAFGGDLEAVNVYSGMLAARHILGADIIVISMGPGIVGTGTKWGFSGVEQGEILNAVDCLHGKAIAVSRISFADKRARHRGISHHSLSVLSRICRVKAVVPLALLKDEEKRNYIVNQIKDNNLLGRYDFCQEDASKCIDLYKGCDLRLSTMGRGVDEEKEYFMTCGAAAITAAKLHYGQKLDYIYQGDGSSGISTLMQV